MLVRYSEGNPVLSFLKRYLFLLTLIPWFAFQMCYLADIPIFGRQPLYLEAKFDQITMVILLVQILLFGQYSPKQLAVIIPLTAIFYAAGRISYTFCIVYCWLFILAAKDQDLELAVKAVYILQLAMTVLVITMFFMGKLPDHILEADSANPRHSWGFCHPNTLGMIMLHLAACRTYIRRKKLGLPDLVLTASSLIFVWLVPYSRSSIFCLGLLELLTLYTITENRLPEKVRRAVPAILVLLAVGCNLFSVSASILYTSKSAFFAALNRLMTKRLSYARKIYRLFGVPLFGQWLPDGFTTAELNGKTFRMPYLDSAYMNLLLKFGLFAYLSYSAVYLLAALRKCRAKEIVLLGILTVYAAHAIMEPSLYELRSNLFILFLACVFMKQESAVQ